MLKVIASSASSSSYVPAVSRWQEAACSQQLRAQRKTFKCDLPQSQVFTHLVDMAVYLSRIACFGDSAKEKGSVGDSAKEKGSAAGGFLSLSSLGNRGALANPDL
eukprot:2783242-Amphidinium_carterae.1